MYNISDCYVDTYYQAFINQIVKLIFFNADKYLHKQPSLISICKLKM